MRNAAYLFAIVLCICVTCPAVARKWTDNSGSFSVEAELVEQRDKEVVLKAADGTSMVVPLDRLSTADRDYLKSLSSPTPTEPPVKKEPPPGTPDSGGKPVPRRAGREAIEQALKLPTTFELAETPLRDALRALTEQHGVELFIDLRALNDLGLDGRLPITADGTDEPLANALGMVLRPVKLVWMIHHDVLFVTTEEVAKSKLETKVYKIVKAMPSFDFLMKLLGESVSPQSWESVGGSGSAAAWPGGAVVVRQTYAVHQEIVDQFDGRLQPIVREAPKAPPSSGRGRVKPLDALRQTSGCSFVETRLPDAIKFLADKHNVEIMIDARALGEVGLPQDVPVTLKLESVPLRSTIALLLRPLNLTWTIRGDALMITTHDVAEDMLTVVGYDVRDMGPLLRGNVDVLLAVIYSTITPTSWVRLGGTGSIEPDPRTGKLQIRHTVQRHIEIDKLLGDLRQVGKRR